LKWKIAGLRWELQNAQTLTAGRILTAVEAAKGKEKYPNNCLLQKCNCSEYCNSTGGGGIKVGSKPAATNPFGARSRRKPRKTKRSPATAKSAKATGREQAKPKPITPTPKTKAESTTTPKPSTAAATPSTQARTSEEELKAMSFNDVKKFASKIGISREFGTKGAWIKDILKNQNGAREQLAAGQSPPKQEMESAGITKAAAVTQPETAGEATTRDLLFKMKFSELKEYAASKGIERQFGTKMQYINDILAKQRRRRLIERFARVSEYCINN